MRATDRHDQVKAHDADDKMYSWQCKISRTSPVRTVMQTWAKLFNFPENVVGFEDEEQRLVALERTPESLGWAAGSTPVVLRAVPLDEWWADLGFTTSP